MQYFLSTTLGGTPIETLYGDVPPKWVGFWQKKSLNMGPIFGPKSLNMGPFLKNFLKIKNKNSLLLEQNP